MIMPMRLGSQGLCCGWSKATAKEAGKVHMEPKEKGLRQEAGLYSESNTETLMVFLIKGDKNRSIF